MENPERKKNPPQRRRQKRIIGGGDTEWVVLWGGAMVVAGVVAGFAMKRRFGRRKDSAEEKIKKSENVKEEEELNDSIVNAKRKQIDLVSALLGEKAKCKEESTNERATIAPVINHAIPTRIGIVDSSTTIDSDDQQVIPFNELKPELVADIVEECNKAMPLNETKAPMERLILKPVMNQLALEAEALTSAPKRDRNVEDEEIEYEGDEESVDETCESSAIWSTEMVEELSRELKGMMIDLGRPEEEDSVIIDKFDGNEGCHGGDAVNEGEAPPIAAAQRWSSWMRLSVLVFLVLCFVFLTRE